MIVPKFLALGLWYTSVLAELYLIGWLKHSKNYRQVPWLFTFLLVTVVQQAVLLPFDIRGWDYARVWAFTDWLTLVPQVAMAWCIFRVMRKYYGANRPLFLAIAYVAIFTCGMIASFSLLKELSQVRWDKPLLVQFALVLHRLITFCLGGTVFFLAIVSWVAQVPARVYAYIAICALYWISQSVVQWMYLVTASGGTWIWWSFWNQVACLGGLVGWIIILRYSSPRETLVEAIA